MHTPKNRKGFADVLLIAGVLILFGSVIAKFAPPATSESQSLNSSLYSSQSLTNSSQKGEEIIENNGSQGLSYEFNEQTQEYALVGLGRAKDEEIVIASLYNGYPVTQIADNVFNKGYDKEEYLSCVKSIIVPEGIKRIGSGCFNSCEGLEQVTLPNSLEFVDGASFANNSLLTGTKEGNLTYVGSVQNPYILLYKSDEDRESLYLEVNANCKFIAPYALTGCYNLQELKLPEGLKCIGDYALWLTELKKVSLPSSLVFISERIFGAFSSPTTYNENGLCYLGNEQNPYLLLFSSDENISVANVNPACKFIYHRAFKNSAISQINFGENSELLIIDKESFSRCYNLTVINLPKNLTHIRSRAFDVCKNLGTLTFEGTCEEWLSIEKADDYFGGIATKVYCENGTANL